MPTSNDVRENRAIIGAKIHRKTSDRDGICCYDLCRNPLIRPASKIVILSYSFEGEHKTMVFCSEECHEDFIDFLVNGDLPDPEQEQA